MGATRRYFKSQFTSHNLHLEHDSASDFCVSCWQRNRSVLPLLFIRLVLFLGCLAIILASLVLTAQGNIIQYWAIYLTHWGLICITLTTGAAFAVSCVAYFKGPIDTTFGLPWYVKLYWALYNISVTLAFFITVYYYLFLTSLDVDYAINPVLDFFCHGANSIIMVVVLMTSRHPTYILHFYYVLLFTIVYAIFSVIYYICGGTDPFGESYIYPMLDWSNPAITFALVIVTAVTLILMYLFTVVLASLRNYIAERFRGEAFSLTDL